jgi:hypothetical protein
MNNIIVIMWDLINFACRGISIVGGGSSSSSSSSSGRSSIVSSSNITELCHPFNNLTITTLTLATPLLTVFSAQFIATLSISRRY